MREREALEVQIIGNGIERQINKFILPRQIKERKPCTIDGDSPGKTKIKI